MPNSVERPSLAKMLMPKLITVLGEGYGFASFRADFIAGLTVAIVALPLSMALAIASGATPDKGLLTAVVAGFFISALGGSRFQIGGPTGAFVVVVFNVIAVHGFDGLVLATFMAGLMLVVAGLLGVGTYIKYVPQPVITGFTAGIAVIIASSQLKDFLGLAVEHVPADFFHKLLVLGAALPQTSPATLAIGAASLGVILGLRRLSPSAPGFLIAVILAALAVWLMHMPIDTIGTRYAGLSPHFAWPTLPEVTLARLRDLLPTSFTIAFLAGVESLLSALVADSMTGRRHRSNAELLAQGIANMASSIVGGLPATGALARTATNIRSGARSPVAGMLHALLLLLFMLVAWPLTSFIPLASLAAVLLVVAWNMSEIDKFAHLMRAPLGDRAVLVLTFVLTVTVDLTVAIEVGVVLAAFLFMHRMSEAVDVRTHMALIGGDESDEAPRISPHDEVELPEGVVMSRISGPFFFGVAMRLGEVLDRIGAPPRVFILDMSGVPIIDATGVSAIEALITRCAGHRTKVVLCGAQPQPRQVLSEMGATEGSDVHIAGTREVALDMARRLVSL